MHEEIIIAGSGGQGIMFLGNLLCNIAASQNKYTTFFPSYGAEMRGGTANCSVIISDDEIGSPVIAAPSILIILNEQSYNRFSPKLKKGGLLFVNSSLVYSKSPDAIYVPATETASQLGDVRSANMVMLGKFIKETKIFPVAAVNEIIKKVLENKKNLLEINLSAFAEGEKL
ncbi:MAG TPA: 2-oxoacid:ferredoxin oxidoreductase subunit gamma [Elusimicrobia bacterium]|nr:2-oxoacid:ferredoxin oxidoreductase subunit gamma [Elusimicrobiota bacterium]